MVVEEGVCGHRVEVEAVYRPRVGAEEVGHQILVRDQEILGAEIQAGRDEGAEVVEEGNNALLVHGESLEEDHRGVEEEGNRARQARGGNRTEDLRDEAADVVYHLQIRGQGEGGDVVYHLQICDQDEEDGVGDHLRNRGEGILDGAS